MDTGLFGGDRKGLNLTVKTLHSFVDMPHIAKL